MVTSLASGSIDYLDQAVQEDGRQVQLGRCGPSTSRRKVRRIAPRMLGIGLVFVAARYVCQSFVPAPGQTWRQSSKPQATATASELLPALGAVLGGLSLAASTMAADAGDPAAVAPVDVVVEPSPADLIRAELTPDNFRPVCPASDSFYNFGKGLGDAMLGAEGAEYRPLVIEALLRVRLEICVLESFIYEAIIPFIQRKGLSWVLPLHETIDTVIAGTVFAVAINFVLFGTTKVLAILSIYHDFLIGALCRLIGFTLLPEKPAAPAAPFIQINWPGQSAPGEQQVAPQPEPEEEEPKEPPILAVAVIGNIFKGYGIVSGFLKDVLEGLDTFSGRYLAITSIFYVGFKWAHFRLFNDFPPF